MKNHLLRATLMAISVCVLSQLIALPAQAQLHGCDTGCLLVSGVGCLCPAQLQAPFAGARAAATTHLPVSNHSVHIQARVLSSTVRPK